MRAKLFLNNCTRNEGGRSKNSKNRKIGRYLGKAGDREVKARVSQEKLKEVKHMCQPYCEQPTLKAKFRIYFNECINLGGCCPIFLEFLTTSSSLHFSIWHFFF